VAFQLLRTEQATGIAQGVRLRSSRVRRSNSSAGSSARRSGSV
jgi:hypothetical protein